jgi:hypothetical protein
MIQRIRKQEGLGDTVEFIAEKLGIAYAVKKAQEMGIIEDCGCGQRKLYLNEKIPYGTRKNGEVLQRESGGSQEAPGDIEEGCSET